MKIFLTDGKLVNMYSLPQKIEDSFLINYQSDTGLEETINIIAVGGKWQIESTPELSFFDGNNLISSATLENNTTFQIKFSDLNCVFFFYCYDTPIQYIEYDLTNKNEVTVGQSNLSTIVYSNPNILPTSIRIINQGSYWILDTLQQEQEIYVNGYRCNTSAVLRLGDTIFIHGFKIIWLEHYIKINVPRHPLSTNLQRYQKMSSNGNHFEEVTDSEKASMLYEDKQIFFHTPRLKETIKHTDISIQLPPSKSENQKAPAILQLGGTMMMGISSSITGVIAIFSVIKGEATLLSSITEIVVCLGMLVGSIFFPMLLENFEKKQNKKYEQKRQTKYRAYLNEKTNDINRAMLKEKQILLENNLEIKQIQTALVNRTNKIWSREITDNDFLTFRLGVGSIKPNLSVKANMDDFTLEDDDLKKEVENIINKKLLLDNVPIVASLIEDKILPIIIKDDYPNKQQYIDGIILQLITYYSGVDLKIAVITSEQNKKHWEYLKYLPHCYSNDGEEHYFATTEEEIKQLASVLEKKRQERIKFYAREDDDEEHSLESSHVDNNDSTKYKDFDCYYLIITDNFISAKRHEFINKIIDSEVNLGFSILMFEDNMKNLPSKCEHFIDIEPNMSGLYSKDLSEENQKTFVPEFQMDNNNADYAQILANIPVIGESMSSTLPTSLSFLEMYKVGKIEQLNITNRWINNDPTLSLHTPLGVHTDGKLFELDLHEKAHGPHGLIAGATGSGKSEFIITFILSMAINYHPYEVQFVLIDYKGGGLAGAFENKETGIRLPHLAGTITNLDTAEMNRTLVSIKSELKRRQRIFNEARDSLNESTVDIYKYQKFFREGKVPQPISHLFIISDEFAELKDQQPDFMEELVSIARIGRSLGVHLILATQKPSGVVDDQIWSNSRFKISLKVQTEEDSMELLKRPDAASIKETGRFYLQVGFNEVFEIGQSGWAGAKYIPTERILKTYEDDINFVDNNGNNIKKINNAVKSENQVDYGDQLTNLVKTLCDIASRNSIQTKSLWLPSISPELYISNLITKYQYKPDRFDYDILIGEYDDPENQFQDKLTVNLLTCGNILIFGSSGSGKENLIMTLLYTSCLYHSSEDVQFYILDFGAEVFGSFNSFPQLGDIATSMEKDKIQNQFTHIQREINRRKELFREYGGSYEIYKRQTNDKLPLLVTVLNNYESFVENYMDLDDTLTSELRESAKYGIIFITSVVATNAMRPSIMQLYQTKIMLQVGDPFDYIYLLDAKQKQTPAKYYGRGMIKLSNGTFEFQTAYIYHKDKINDAIKEVGSKLQAANMLKAPKIPAVPREVTYENMLSEITDIDAVPIGYNIDTAEISRFNFIKHKISFISGTQINTEPQFLLDLINLLATIPSIELKIIDLADNMSECGIDECYNGEFTSVINNMLTAEEETKQKIIYIITGIGYIYDRVLDEGIKTLFDIFQGKIALDNSYFILADNYVSMRKLEKEEWYQTAHRENGIWIGQNFADETVIQTDKVADYDTNEEFLGLVFNVKDKKYEVVKSIGSKIVRGW